LVGKSLEIKKKLPEKASRKESKKFKILFKNYQEISSHQKPTKKSLEPFK
jgi:hypothetical protein